MELIRLQDAIEEFRALHPEYATPQGAQDQCRVASAQFIDLLIAKGFIDIRCLRQEWENFEMGVVDEVVHRAVRLGCVLIDWTARQFDANADFPSVTVDESAWFVVGEEENT